MLEIERKIETFYWTQETEKNYQKMKSKYEGKDKSMGLQQHIWDLNKTNLNDQQKDELHKKLQNNDNLDLKEIKFIADTSELINSCIDKKFLQ